MEYTAHDLWQRVLELARERLPEPGFRTWLGGSEASAITADSLVVDVPSPFHVEWVEDKYGTVLHLLLEEVLGRPLPITLRCTGGDGPRVPVVELSPGPGAPSAAPGSAREGGGVPGGLRSGAFLNERYTFDRFVVGNSNQLAAAACQAVAEQPGRLYNPLFLYGGVGLGKTHLMHAVGNHILAKDPTKRIGYVPSEQFMNELVNAIQSGTTGEFRRRYRETDLLLVDDVHFLEGKERTQEEFFHTFNALHDGRKQIVLTSDRPPKEIPGLEERLISRFEWGLVADLKLPDYETRVAILRKKAHDDGITLDDEVMDYIARHCTSSVRELEGAVIKLLAFSSLKHLEISVPLARAALDGVLRSREESSTNLSPRAIREVVAREWEVRSEALSSKRRTRDLAVPRQVAMYLIKELLGLPLVEIGDLFGGRDHSTVIHSIRKVEETMGADPHYANRITAVRTRLEGR
ncbi:MAG: chromosomal replication initiator protein DnaA [Gemmatimonadota bacterium]